MTTTVNLIPYYRRDARITRLRLRKWGIACLAYCCIASATAGGLMTRSDSSGVVQLEGAIADASLDVQALSERVQDLKARVGEAARFNAATEVRYPQPDWSILLGLFASCADESVLLDSCSVEPRFKSGDSANVAENPRLLDSPEMFRVDLSGWAENQRAVSDYILTLERTQLFENLTLSESTRQTFRSGHAVKFRIEAELKSVVKRGRP